VDDLIDLVRDNQSAAGRLVTSGVVVAVAVMVAWVAGEFAARRSTDVQSRYYARKLARYVVAAITIVVLGVVWRAFAGRVGVVLGVAAAGLAFAMQEVIGAVAGWFNILSGRIFRVGDRIQMGGVRGDVIDITPLRTKVMEIGSPHAEESWVRGRQFTGRIVAISNKATFTEPVFNYSASFDYLWEEISVPIAFDSDWREAIRILEEEARRVSAGVDAAAAIRAMRRSYPVPPAELEPRVFATPTDNYLELAARFIVPVRTARTVKDELARRVVGRLDEAGIAVASTTSTVRVDLPDGLGHG
jgi:small-conductance mechanosensitive channel